jgi:hypothetical protein
MGERTIPSTSSHPSAVLILKDAALQSAGTGFCPPGWFCLLGVIPECIVWPYPPPDRLDRPAWSYPTGLSLTVRAGAAGLDAGSVSGKNFLVGWRWWDIAGPRISPCRPIPVLGMLKIVLRGNFIPSHFGLLREFQITGVPRHGAAAATLTARRVGPLVSRWLLTSRKPVAEFGAVVVRRRH